MTRSINSSPNTPADQLPVERLVDQSSLTNEPPTARQSVEVDSPPADPVASMSADQRRAMLQELLRRQAESSRCFEMSAGQQGLWYAFRREPLSTAFNVFLPSRVVSPLDVDALRRAMDYLVDRHSCLRTTFSDTDADLKQTVHESLPPEFVVIDASEMTEADLRQDVLAQTQRPFDLERGPLMRMAVFRRGENDHVIVATTHHIVVDFWSLIVLLNELREVYRCFEARAEPRLAPAAGNYASFVAEQRAMLGGEKSEALWQHWQGVLDGAPHVLNWFTDYERPASFTGRADVVPLRFDSRIAEQIKRVASQQSTTTNAVVIAALQVLIARYTREKDFLIGSPFVGRGHRKYENTVGFFVNTLPLRADLSDNPTFAQLVRRVSHSLLSSLEHESLPLSEIVRRTQPPRDSSRSPLFQVTCTLEKSHIREETGRAGFLMPSEQESANIGGMQQENYYVPHPTCHHDIEFIFEQTESALRGMICYCRDLFAKETIGHVAENFASLFESLCDSPDVRVEQVPWGNRARFVDEVRRKLTEETPAKRETLVDLLEHAFARHPDSIALLGEESIDFAQLDRESGRIASSLRASGVGRGDIVPVAGKQGSGTITALIGVIRSGAAVVPIDTECPAVSLSDLVEDARPKVVLIDEPTSWSRHIGSLGGETDVVEIGSLLATSDSSPCRVDDVTSDDLAYVIYTSGSTGRPKGVMIQHGAITNTVRWRMDNVKLSTDDRVLMLLSHQFDAGFGIAISSLVQGAGLVLPESNQVFDIHSVIDRIVKDGVTVLPAVPSLLHLLVNHPRFAQCHCIRQFWSGGETMPRDLPSQIRAKSNARIWNFYGPTETAVEATAFEVIDVDSDRAIPIGQPIANTEVVVVDEHGSVVPDTVPGQLAIAGRGLATGYLNQAERTKASFVPVAEDEGSGRRLYLTGDLARRRADGQLEFLGRIDQQVKIRGYRIELEEIDQVLRSHPMIENAAAKVIHPSSGAAKIAAFVIVDEAYGDGKDRLISDIQRHMADQLPSYKRPTTIDIVLSLPTGVSGKVRRDELPDPTDQRGNAIASVPPSTPFEQHLVDEWAEMLDVDRVAVNQNFFELGGTSLQAAMMTARLTEKLGVHVPTSLLFDLADIASMASRLVELHRDAIESRFGPESVRTYESSHEQSPGGHSGQHHPLIAALKPDGGQHPIFMIHPPGGIVICYRELARALASDQPLLAIRSRGLHGEETLPESIQQMAADYVDAIRLAQPNGDYVIGGWSLGGVIAYEVARQLTDDGARVGQLILLDSTIPDGASECVDRQDSGNVGLEYGIDLTLDQLSQLEEDDQLPFLWQHAVNLGVVDESSPQEVIDHVLNDLKNLFHHHVKLTSAYQIKSLDVPTLLVRPTDVPVQVVTSEDRGWGKLISQVDVRFVSGHHHSMVQQPHVPELARVIEASLSKLR